MLTQTTYSQNEPVPQPTADQFLEDYAKSITLESIENALAATSPGDMPHSNLSDVKSFASPASHLPAYLKCQELSGLSLSPESWTNRFLQYLSSDVQNFLETGSKSSSISLLVGDMSRDPSKSPARIRYDGITTEIKAIPTKKYRPKDNPFRKPHLSSLDKHHDIIQIKITCDEGDYDTYVDLTDRICSTLPVDYSVLSCRGVEEKVETFSERTRTLVQQNLSRPYTAEAYEGKSQTVTFFFDRSVKRPTLFEKTEKERLHDAVRKISKITAQVGLPEQRYTVSRLNKQFRSKRREFVAVRDLQQAGEYAKENNLILKIDSEDTNIYVNGKLIIELYQEFVTMLVSCDDIEEILKEQSLADFFDEFSTSHLPS